MSSKHPIRNRDDLSMIYTPGVARVCMAIAENPEDARRLTIKRNTVAVVTDGSAVLGLGNIGPQGRAARSWRARRPSSSASPASTPGRICLDTQDTDAIVEIVKAIAPGFAGHQPGGHLRAPLLRDRGAAARGPRHPGLPRRPARHRDRRARRAHQRAARGRTRQIEDVRVVMSGAGAAGTAILKLLIAAGVKHAVVADIHGVVHAGREDLVGRRRRTRRCAGSPTTPTPRASPARSRRPCVGADVFIGVSAPNVLDGDDVARDGRRRDRVRARQPRPGGRPGRRPADGGGGRHRPLRLPEPDQQRAGLPRCLPRSAGRAVPYGQHRDDAGRGAARSRTSSPRTSSTRTTSSRASSTTRSRARSPVPSATPRRRPARL